MKKRACRVQAGKKKGEKRRAAFYERFVASG